MIDAEILRALRHDIRAWPGGRSIHADHEPDAFAPTTLAVVVQLFDLPADHPLIARAETPEWSARDAEALIDLIAERMAAAVASSADVAFLAQRERAARAAATARTKNKGLSPAQRRVLDAAAELGLADRLHVPGTPAAIARRLNDRGFASTSSDVAKCIKRIDEKGLLPQQRDDA